MIDQWARDSLVPDPPRAVPRWFFLRRMRVMVFCGLLLTGLGVVLGGGLPLFFYVVSGCVSPIADSQLDRNHSSTTAVIRAKKLVSHTEIGSRHPWKVTFQFVTPEGMTVDAVGYTYDQSLATGAAGDEIEVEYDPADPSRARPAGGSASLFPPWAFLLTWGLLLPESLGGPIMLIAAGVRARRQRLLLTHGAGAEAEVVQVRRIGYIRFGSRNPYDVYYRFHDYRGLEVTGQDRTYHYGWAEELKAGDKVGVVYNPRGPAANVLWLHGGDTRSGP